MVGPLDWPVDDGGRAALAAGIRGDRESVFAVAVELVRDALTALVTEEGVVREAVPNPTSEGGIIPAVYLVPFHRAECSLAGSLLRLLHHRADRLSAFADVDWGRTRYRASDESWSIYCAGLGPAAPGDGPNDPCAGACRARPPVPCRSAHS